MRRIIAGTAIAAAALFGSVAPAMAAPSDHPSDHPVSVSQTFTAYAGDPATALIDARKMANDYDAQIGGGCNEVGSNSSWMKRPGPVPNTWISTGVATVDINCWVWE